MKKLALAAAFALGLAPLAAHAQVGGQDWSADLVTDGANPARTISAFSADERVVKALGLTALQQAPNATASQVYIAPIGGGPLALRQITSGDITGLPSGLLNISNMTAAFTFATNDSNGYNDCLSTVVNDNVTGTAGHNDTVPLGFPVGCVLRVAQLGTDPVTLAGASAAVVIKSPGSLTLTGINTSAKLLVIASSGTAETLLLSSGY